MKVGEERPDPAFTMLKPRPDERHRLLSYSTIARCNLVFRSPETTKITTNAPFTKLPRNYWAVNAVNIRRHTNDWWLTDDYTRLLYVRWALHVRTINDHIQWISEQTSALKHRRSCLFTCMKANGLATMYSHRPIPFALYFNVSNR